MVDSNEDIPVLPVQLYHTVFSRLCSSALYSGLEYVITWTREMGSNIENVAKNQTK